MSDLWELPAGWRWTSIADVAKVVGGSTPKTSEPSYWGGPIPWITPDDLSGYSGTFIERGRRSITQAGYDSCSTQMVPEGTVLFTSRAPIGYVAIAAGAVCTNQGFKSFVCGPQVDPAYLYWYLRRSTELARSLASGTTFLELSGKAAARIPVPVPPLEVQRRIVKGLEEQMTRIDAAVAAISAAATRLRRYKSRALSAAVEDRDGWPVAQLGDIVVSLRNGLSHKPEGNEGVRILRISAVRPMVVDLEDVRYLDNDKADDRFLIQTDDLLFTRYNGNPELVGVCGRVRDVQSPTLHPDKLIRARVDEARATSAFLEIALNTGIARQHIRRSTKTTAGQAGIAGSDLKKTPVALPPLGQQKRIVATAQSLLAGAVDVEKSIVTARRRADRLRLALLAAAFAGRMDGVA